MTRRSKADWQALIEECTASGLTAAEFCRRKGLNAKYFSLRKRKLGNTNSAFVKIKPTGITDTGASAHVAKVRIIELNVPLSDLAATLAALRC